MSSRSALEKSMLALAAILLLVLLILWLASTVRWRPPAAQAMDFQGMRAVISAPQTNLSHDSNALLRLLQRPLFVLGRLPPPPEKAQADAAGGPGGGIAWDKVMLQGVVEGAVSGIIFRVDGKDRRLLLGQSFEGWELTAVQPHAAELMQAGQTRVLKLQKTDYAKAQPVRATEAVRRTPTPAASATVKTQAPSNAPANAPKDEPEPKAVFGGTSAK